MPQCANQYFTGILTLSFPILLEDALLYNDQNHKNLS